MDTFISFMLILSGVCWTAVYAGIIYRGFKDRSTGMPLIALGLNFAWEFQYAFVFPVENKVQLVINGIWAFFDVIIIYQKFRFGREEYESNLNGLGNQLYYPTLILAFVLSFLAVMTAKIEFNDFIGLYSAFIMNLLMSVAFIPMLLKRGNLNGQSFYIALFKLIGTLAPTILFTFFFRGFYKITETPAHELSMNSGMEFGTGVYHIGGIAFSHPLIFLLGISCFIYDTIYLILVCREYKKLGYNIFTRKPRGLSSDNAVDAEKAVSH